jgi:MoxR-like ATPase
MPADIVGSMIMEGDDRGGKMLRFQRGPVFAHLVLADEINRATPKTQSALLEAMQERTVTSGTTTHELEAPFLVMATQNPIEMEGTYPLPEAQLDRFLMKILVTYPSRDELSRIVERTIAREEATPDAVLDPTCRTSPSNSSWPRSRSSRKRTRWRKSMSATAVRRAAHKGWSSAAACAP